MASRDPHRFEITLDRPAGAALLHAGERPTIVGGAPPEFGGTADVWSPEHLLLSAVALCFLTTFDFFLRRSPMAVSGFRCRAEGTVEKTPKGLAFTSVRLEAHAEVPTGEGERARELLARAEHACLVSNSLACPVTLVTDVVETGAPLAQAAP